MKNIIALITLVLIFSSTASLADCKQEHIRAVVDIGEMDKAMGTYRYTTTAFPAHLDPKELIEAIEQAEESVQKMAKCVVDTEVEDSEISQLLFNSYMVMRTMAAFLHNFKEFP